MTDTDPIDPRIQARRILERMARKGVRSLYLDDATAPVEDAAGPQSSLPPPQPREAVTMENTVRDDSSVVEALEALQAEVAACTQCALHESRTNTVFGVGTHRTRVMFIGEAPGRDEDLKGEPFVGRAGQLLNKILAAMDLSREEVYIGNILKCRPPSNRDPQESEVRCCESFLKRQIELIRPDFICALGRVSAQWLLQTNATLGAIRSGEYYYEGVRVIATYHPAALLRNSNFKKPCWEDMKKLRALIDEVDAS